MTINYYCLYFYHMPQRIVRLKKYGISPLSHFSTPFHFCISTCKHVFLRNMIFLRVRHDNSKGFQRFEWFFHFFKILFPIVCRVIFSIFHRINIENRNFLWKPEFFCNKLIFLNKNWARYIIMNPLIYKDFRILSIYFFNKEKSKKTKRNSNNKENYWKPDVKVFFTSLKDQ